MNARHDVAILDAPDGGFEVVCSHEGPLTDSTCLGRARAIRAAHEEHHGGAR